MRKIFQILLLVLFVTLLPVWVQAQIPPYVITGESNADVLARKIAGPGVEVFNATYSGPENASGIYSSVPLVGPLFGNNGVLMTNGFAKTTRGFPGSNEPYSTLATNDRGGRGDPDIDAFLTSIGLPPGIRSTDAVTLEFDFKPTGNSVDFVYRFASEEYPEKNCALFNDLFFIYISGPGITGKKNMALVPGTNVPVCINTINNGVVNPRSNIANCERLDPNAPFTSYYYDNTFSNYVVYDGMTVPMVARYAVRSCFTYHIKIVIADIGDGTVDSGLFLSEGGLSSDFASLSYAGPRENGEIVLYEGCEAAQIKLAFSDIPTEPRDIYLEVRGTADDTELSPGINTTVTIPAGQQFVFFPVGALQDLIADDDEYFMIYASPKTCGGDPIFTDSLRIRIRDYKDAGVEPDLVGICPGNGGAQLNATLPGLSNFNWTPSAGLNNATIQNPVATPDTTTRYTLIADLSATCHAKDTVRVIVKDTNAVVWTIRNVSCRGHDGKITVFAFPTFEPPIVYSLDGSPFAPFPVFNNVDTGWHILIVRDAVGCEVTKNIRIIKNEDITATVRGENANCAGFNGHMYVSAQGGQPPYQYSLNGLNYQDDSAIIVLSGSYTVYVKDAYDCVFTLTAGIGTDPPLNISTVVTADSCRGLPDGTVTVTATGGTGVYEYSSDGVNFQTSNVLQVPGGNHTITVRDDNECTGTQDVVVPLNNTVVVEAGLDTTICEGASVVLRATGNALNYLWSPPAGLNNAQLQRPVATPSITTQYKITATSGLCVQTDSLNIFVNKAPIPNAGPDTSICYSDQVRLNGSGASLFLWYPAQYISNRHIADPLVYPKNTALYWLVVTDDLGCRSLSADTVKVTVVPPVRPFAGNDTIVAVNQPLQLNATGGTTYLWSPPTGLNNAGIASPVAVLQNHQTYTVTASTPEGCTGSTSINIKVYRGPEIYVAGAFTPNNDGNNDMLFAIPAGIKQFRYFKVFNRWGKEVFFTTEYRKGWNGRWKETEQQPDTYIWMAEGEDFNGKVVYRKGTVILIR